MPEPDRLAGHGCLGLFLVEGGGGGGIGRPIGLSNFRVIAVLLRDHMLAPGRGVPVACVYEGMCGWRDVSCTWRGDINIPKMSSSFCFARRANGSLYWAIRGARTALVIDEATTGSRALISRWPSTHGTRGRVASRSSAAKTARCHCVPST